MAEQSSAKSVPLLPTIPDEPHVRKFALGVVLVSIAVFLSIAPFAKVKLVPITPFIPIYESSLFINDLITAVLLFGQFSIVRSRAMLLLACGYLFTSAMTIPHALTFPGLFSPTGLLGAGSQSTAWIYVFWHAGFPLILIAYTFLNRQERQRPQVIRRPGIAILYGIAAVIVIAFGCTWLAIEAHDALPAILVSGHYTPMGRLVLSSTWATSLVALAILWRHRAHSMLDLWLLVVLCAWLFDIALSAVLNGGRFDLGFYAGRIYGLMAASCVLIVLILENNKLYARLVIAHQDVLMHTENLQRLNKELEQAKLTAEQANQAKSAFLSSMSHELRTPLNAILGFGQILASDSLPVAENKKKEFIAYIVNAGKHLLTLINEILDLAKIESGALSLSLESVALSEILCECQEMIEPIAGKRNIRVAFPSDDNLYVIADRTRLKQVLLNLLSNAVKYNREEGTITVNCTTLPSERIRITIQDTGEGLDPAQLGQLFQPFNRLGQESGKQEGTGIGLVVTKRLVELMGGTIDVTSTVGTGSVFGVELKSTHSMQYAGSKGSATASALENASAGAGQTTASQHTILYVEDNPANLRLIQELIGLRPELRLITATDARLGIDMAHAHKPAVILMDINLPGMSGSEAMMMLRADPAMAHIPVIALSANAMPRDVAQGMSSGFFRYLTKPIDVDMFFTTLDSALESSEKKTDSV